MEGNVEVGKGWERRRGEARGERKREGEERRERRGQGERKGSEREIKLKMVCACREKEVRQAAVAPPPGVTP